MSLFFSWARAATLTIWIWIVLLLLTKHAVAQLPIVPTYTYVNGCNASNGNYTAYSSYDVSLKAVLSELASRASAGMRHYSTSSAANQVYGQYYCRADVSSSLCSDCIKAAINVASNGGACFPISQGVVWFYECTLQYSNESKLFVEEKTPVASYSSPFNVSRPTTFAPLLAANIRTLISNLDSHNFATGKEYVSGSETLYTLVQCQPILNFPACEDCINSAYDLITTCCGDYSSTEAHVFYPSCMLMYNLQPFYYPLQPTPALPPSQHPSSGSENITKVVVPVLVISLFLLLGFGLLISWCCKKINEDPTKKKKTNEAANPSGVVIERVPSEEQQPADNGKDIVGNVECFNFKTIKSATANFSDVNKLGEGGFGSVYKGILPNGQVIAVKRLSKSSDHHIREFTTEVAVVAKLQHRNLVRLIGFSAFQEERILAYEFLPNLSLEKNLFDTTKSINMDWTTRVKIIEGIALGLRYLHVDSLLTIVHRDLKTSNILLDKDMIPKIADFGLAKLVTIDETTINVTTVAGTMGYMAPEYIMAGRCTVKSDIYSFGVIILEIISGKNIAKFYDPITNDGLLHHAWRLWNERDIEGLMDPALQNQYSWIESERCLQIGLLCVQDDEEKRPTIRILMSMLDNQSLELPYPTPSTFYGSKTPKPYVSEQGKIQYQASSTNQLQVPYYR